MKITPIEIRQKTFESKFRGYDKDEVNAYLQTLSREWEKMLDENKELKIKLENAEKEVEKLREVESSLFKTLKTAEDTGASMIDQANKAAELHLRETEMKADALMSEAKSKAKTTLEEAELKAKAVMEDMEEELKAMGQIFKTLKNNRDNLISDLKGLTNDILDRVERTTQQMKDFDVDEYIQKTRDFKIDVSISSLGESDNEAPRLKKDINNESSPENRTKDQSSETEGTKEDKADKEDADKEDKEDKERSSQASGSSGSKSFFDDIE